LNRQNAKHAARAAKGNAQKQYVAHDVRNVLFGGAHRALGVLAVQKNVLPSQRPP
jgi:hypothetical protein